MTRNENIDYCLINNLISILEMADNLTDIQLGEFVEASKYPKRRKDGQNYSDMMGARLLQLNAPDEVKKIISEYFKESQRFLCQGWWKSAIRDLNVKEANAYINEDLLNDVKTFITNYIIVSYV